MRVRGLAAAFAYFSVWPMGRTTEAAPGGNFLAYLPLVGVLTGAIAGAAAYGVSLIAPHQIAVAVAFVLSIALNGALHVDGFLDSCDALFARVAPARRLEIMKDPHHGTFAIAYFAMVCVVWVAALSALPPRELPATLAFAAGTARWAAILNSLRYPHARGGRASRVLIVVSGVALVALSLVVNPRAWIVVPVVTLVSVASARWAAGRLGGTLPGDVYGALIVTGELTSLVLCASLLAW